MAETLSNFIVLAKKNTYSKSAKEKMNPDGSRDFFFKKGNLSCSDKYYGTRSFSCQETFFSGKTLLWSIVYTGRSLVSGSEEKMLEEFLKKFLSRVERDSQFRGQLSFRIGKFSYENTFFGSLSMFSGSGNEILWGSSSSSLLFRGGC